MSELGDKEVEVGGQKISPGTTIRFTLKTAMWILGAMYVGLGYLYFDLRTEFKEANGISTEEKAEFLKEVDKEYEGKFTKMFEDISDMKGDIKVILDRTSRQEVITQNPGGQIDTATPPPNNTQSPSN